MKKIQIIKYGLLAALLVFLVLVYMNNNIKDVPGETLVKTVENLPGVSQMEKGDAATFKRYYHLAESDYDTVVFYYSPDTMAVDELLVVKMTDENQAQELKQALEGRISDQKQNFDGYGTNQMGLLNQAEVQINGKYAFLAISEQAADWKSQYLELIK
ncbi:MAG: DUF4358 domain-containing protein [Lachnospiraceae bacterium]|nr:DUF4358 domain-containing protein [Lachnospiraceae bacterium]